LAESELDRRKIQRVRRETARSSTSAGLNPLAPSHAINANNAIQRAHDPRATLTPSDLLSLQRSIGNQSVQRILAQRQSAAAAPVINIQRTQVERANQPANYVTSINPQFSPPQFTPVISQQSAPPLVRSMDNAPQRNIKHHAPMGHIQRASNWDDFKRYSKGIWGTGGKFRDENRGALNFIDPRQHYQKHAQKGGGWNKLKGVGSGVGHVLASPFAGLYGMGSLLGRGLETAGAGAYYGAKGIGSGVSSVGSSIKSAYNRDRNPNGYDRDRVPNSAKTSLEVGKPGISLGSSGATLGMSEAMSTGAGFPAGAGLLNLLTTGDSLLTWRNGNKRYDQAKQRNDQAGMKVGKRKANQGKWGVLGGTAGIAQNALNLGVALKTGSQGLMSVNDVVGKAHYVSTGLGVAGGAMGIVGGAITTGQGLWKAGKALSKWRKLSKSAPMLTPDGDRWKAHIKDRQKTKVGLNTLKTIGGILGIAAGALIIASNPVGWALGVAAAATVGGLVAYKLYTKWKKTRRKQKAKVGVRQDMQLEQQAPPNLGMDHQNDGGGEPGRDNAGMQNADPTRLEQSKRKQAVELGNRVAQKVSKSGKVAGEIRHALSARHDRMVGMLMEVLEKKHFTPEFIRKNNVKNYPFSQSVLKVHDALVMMSVLNLTPEVVESESGQELIEKKLSATDSL